VASPSLPCLPPRHTLATCSSYPWLDATKRRGGVRVNDSRCSLARHPHLTYSRSGEPGTRRVCVRGVRGVGCGGAATTPLPEPPHTNSLDRGSVRGHVPCHHQVGIKCQLGGSESESESESRSGSACAAPWPSPHTNPLGRKVTKVVLLPPSDTQLVSWQRQGAHAHKYSHMQSPDKEREPTGSGEIPASRPTLWWALRGPATPARSPGPGRQVP
jgi:hypothetical protein